MSNRKSRLAEFEKMPFFARLDHRRFLNKDGKLPFFDKMSRKKRRKLKAESRKIAAFYNRLLEGMSKSGTGFPIDQLLRSMAIEYTNRFASSGTEHLPVSFNYFEPFCEGKLIPQSFAPYLELLPETDHLFSSSDFFEYVTSEDSAGFEIASLRSLPEARVYNFSANGDILALTFTDGRSRDYVLSGFTMVRRGRSIHWGLVAGENLSTDEWKKRSTKATPIDLSNITPSKRAFLKNKVEEEGSTTGAPLLLEGTETAVRTVLAGEIDAEDGKHVGRAIFVEHENAYDVFCDDPEIFGPAPLSSQKKRDILERALERIDEAGALWSVAEGLLQLPAYFEARVTIEKEIAGSNSIPKGLKGKGGRGLRTKYQVVESVEVTDDKKPPIVRRVALPQYQIETEGHWRRLKFGETGKDRDGKPVDGKTWVKRSSPWRAKNDRKDTVYVKDSIAAARARVAELYDKAANEKQAPATASENQSGELYVLRCSLMQEEVYKVGWTSGSAEDRAKQLSGATGVPLAFVVVESWKHDDAEGLETDVHAILAPYRLNNQREFFRVNFHTLKRLIETTIERTGD